MISLPGISEASKAAIANAATMNQVLLQKQYNTKQADIAIISPTDPQRQERLLTEARTEQGGIENGVHLFLGLYTEGKASEDGRQMGSVPHNQLLEVNAALLRPVLRRPVAIHDCRGLRRMLSRVLNDALHTACTGHLPSVCLMCQVGTCHGSRSALAQGACNAAQNLGDGDVRQSRNCQIWDHAADQ